MALTIIVSNRLPVVVKKVRGVLEFAKSDGGLASGLASYTKGKSSLWVGWPGIASDELTNKDKKRIISELKKSSLVPVFLTQKQIDGFYNHFSNGVLWPLFHNLPYDIHDAARYYKTYESVNESFAEAVASITKPKSMLWLHDYQLLLLPEMLRGCLGSSVTIGFFLHIPFPGITNYEKLPQAKALLRGMLGASLIGFHTTSYGDEFLECCQQLHIGTASENQVILSNRTVKVADFPIGIDYKKFANGIKSKSVQLEILKLQLKYRRYKIILTVDRLDPSKGFIERLEAYSEFLYLNPNLHKKVKMVMLTIPSRTDVKAYKVLKIRIDELVRKINRTYGTNNWQPIDFMYQSVPFEVLSALYQIADVAFVVPTKDGMNLVAKEYVASQQGHNGVLVLSETAGAAQELTDAVLVNPKKRQSIVAGLELALAMPQAALTIRLTSMQKQLAKNTIQTWAKGFMNSMEKTLPAQPLLTKQLNNSRLNDLTRSYLAAKKRLMLFDYDGVLVRFYDKPGDAVLKRSTYKLLAKLAEEPKNTIAIISGRPKVDMDRWLGALGIGLAAEHGGYIKQKNVWRCTADNSHDWKQTIIAIMQYYAASTPGAFVEEKNLVLAWHYRTSPPYLAQKNLVVLKRVLLPYLRQYGLQFFDGKKVLEVKSPNVNKAVAVRHWFNTSYDFVMVIGDDYTDEDMFSAVPARSYTIKVGAGKTAAKFRVKNVAAVTEILEKLN